METNKQCVEVAEEQGRNGGLDGKVQKKVSPVVAGSVQKIKASEENRRFVDPGLVKKHICWRPGNFHKASIPAKQNFFEAQTFTSPNDQQLPDPGYSKVSRNKHADKVAPCPGNT